MTANTHLSIASWGLALNAALDTPLANGFVEIYSGVQPATPDTAITSQVLLCTLTLSATPFAAASGGSKAANTITGANAVATGLATWFRAFESNGTTAVIDGSAGTAGTDMTLSNASLVSGEPVSCSAWSVSMPVGQ